MSEGAIHYLAVWRLIEVLGSGSGRSRCAGRTAAASRPPGGTQIA